MTRYDELHAEVIEFHRRHPEIWQLFVRFTKEAIASGRTTFGAKAIWERLRWETQVNPQYADVGEVKINNNYVSFYARRFLRVYPEHAGFFKTRRQISAMAPGEAA